MTISVEINQPLVGFFLSLKSNQALLLTNVDVDAIECEIVQDNCGRLSENESRTMQSLQQRLSHKKKKPTKDRWRSTFDDCESQSCNIVEAPSAKAPQSTDASLPCLPARRPSIEDQYSSLKTPCGAAKNSIINWAVALDLLEDDDSDSDYSEDEDNYGGEYGVDDSETTYTYAEDDHLDASFSDDSSCCKGEREDSSGGDDSESSCSDDEDDSIVDAQKLAEILAVSRGRKSKSVTRPAHTSPPRPRKWSGATINAHDWTFAQNAILPNMQEIFRQAALDGDVNINDRVASLRAKVVRSKAA